MYIQRALKVSSAKPVPMATFSEQFSFLFNVFSLLDFSVVIFSSEHRLHDRPPAE